MIARNDTILGKFSKRAFDRPIDALRAHETHGQESERFVLCELQTFRQLAVNHLRPPQMDYLKFRRNSAEKVPVAAAFS